MGATKGSTSKWLGWVLLFITVSYAGRLEAQTQSLVTQAINNGDLVSLPGNIHPLVRPEFDKGAAPDALPMERMLLVLKRSASQEKTLESYLDSLHDPKSAHFHRWLTPEQFGAKFGASSTDIAKIVAWLKQSGFQVQGVSRGGTSIEFSGTAGLVRQIFHTQIHQYTVKGESHWANANNPQLPRALASAVAGVASLHNFTKQSTLRLMGQAKIAHEGRTTKIVPANPTFSTNGSNYLTPGDFWTIYNATPLITASSNRIDGTGQTIAIAGRSDVTVSDISAFRSTLLPAPYSGTLPFNQINNGPDPGVVSPDSLENTLDVEWSSALAPAATITLVVSQTTATTDGVDLSDL